MNNFSCPYDSDKHIEMPTRSTKHSAGYDFKSPIDFVIPAHGISDFIDTGVTIHLDHDKVLLLFTRSGNGLKKQITLLNNVGVVDSDYFPNTIGCRFRNDSDEDFYVKAGDKIMQGIIIQYFTVENEGNITTERTSGFGSTGR